MLYFLLYEVLFAYFTPLRVFRYVTTRTAFASLTALFLCLVLGPWLISKLRQFQIGQHIREDGPQSHLAKAGTPTMGGVLIILSMLISTLLWADLANPNVWIALFGMLSFGTIGFIDDYRKVTRKRNLGFTVRQKFACQVLAAVTIGCLLVWQYAHGHYRMSLNVPFFKQFRPDLLITPWLDNPWTFWLAAIPFFLFLILVLVGASNAVNITDGLDGLAIGLMVIASGAMTVLCYTSGHAELATYLDLVRLPGAAELTVFSGAMTGACMGFLWYNAHPAQIFMGDVGALALGGALGTVAVLIKQEILLLFIGGVFVIEALSVMLQVGSYKLRRKRILKMAPIHHHFEHIGWTETQVVTRFWITGLVLALFALTTLKLR